MIHVTLLIAVVIAFSFYWKQKDDVRAATSDEVMQAYLKDCKSCIEDMNLEDNFND